MKVQIALIHIGADLRSIERGPEAIGFPRATTLIGQDCGRALRNPVEYLAEIIVHRNDCLPPTAALAGRERDRILSDV